MATHCLTGEKCTVYITFPGASKDTRISLNSPTTVNIKSESSFDLSKLTQNKRYDVEVTYDHWQRNDYAILGRKQLFINVRNPVAALPYCDQANFSDFWVSPPGWKTNAGYVCLTTTSSNTDANLATFNGVKAYYFGFGAMQGLRNFSVTNVTPKEEPTLPPGAAVSKYWIEISNPTNGIIFISNKFNSAPTYSIICGDNCPEGYCKIDCPNSPGGYCCLSHSVVNSLLLQI